MWPLYSRLSERSTAQDWRQCRVVEGTVFQDGMVLPVTSLLPCHLFAVVLFEGGLSW